MDVEEDERRPLVSLRSVVQPFREGPEPIGDRVDLIRIQAAALLGAHGAVVGYDTVQDPPCVVGNRRAYPAAVGGTVDIPAQSGLLARKFVQRLRGDHLRRDERPSDRQKRDPCFHWDFLEVNGKGGVAGWPEPRCRFPRRSWLVKTNCFPIGGAMAERGSDKLPSEVVLGRPKKHSDSGQIATDRLALSYTVR